MCNEIPEDPDHILLIRMGLDIMIDLSRDWVNYDDLALSLVAWLDPDLVRFHICICAFD